MKKKSAALFLIVVAVLSCITVTLCACNDKEEKQEEQSNNYDVAGYWLSHDEQKYNGNYGIHYTLSNDLVFHFLEDGMVLLRTVSWFNTSISGDTGWIALNCTWTVSNNILAFENGDSSRKFVIYEDAFTDMLNGKVYKFVKVESDPLADIITE